MKPLLTALCVLGVMALAGCGGGGEPTLEVLGAQIQIQALRGTNRCLVCDLRCRYSTGDGGILITSYGNAPEDAPDATYYVKGEESIQRLGIKLAGTFTDTSQLQQLNAIKQSARITTSQTFAFGSTKEHVLLTYKDLKNRDVTYAFVYDPSRDWPQEMGIR